MKAIDNLKMIVARGRNGEIGVENDLIWKIPEDQKFFKKMTKGANIVMGAATFKSLPGELPDRKHIVITRDLSKCDTGNVCYVHDIHEVHNKIDKDRDTYIIGGGIIYKLGLEYCKELYITDIEAGLDTAHTYFPEFNESEWKKEVLECKNCDTTKLGYTITKYTR